MSDTVTCDGCKGTGTRRRGTICPDGWWYLAAVDEEAALECGDRDEATTIVFACSPECRSDQWRLGPGKLDLRGRAALAGEGE